MAATITLFEHETAPFAWSDRDLAAIARLNRAVGAEVLGSAVQGRQRLLQAHQMVGVVRLGSRTLQILPKIYRAGAEEQQRAREATRNLLYLLTCTGEVPVHEYELASLLQRDLDWFEILTYLFASHLRGEWRCGAYRGYQVVEAELPVLKGKWRIAEQLRRPDHRQHFVVAYDEFSADNHLNRVFRFVVERLWFLSRDAQNRQLLGELRELMDEVTLLPCVTVAEAAPALLTRLNRRYEPLLNLARLFLAGGALQLTAGELNTFAFVFDMNQLFEAFLVGFIRRHRQEILPASLQDCDLLPQSHGAALYLARTGTRPVFHLKPDLAFCKGHDFPLLLDAKYKRLRPTDIKLGISQDDFYQMHAYARRYNCPRVALIYPQTVELGESLYRCFALEGCNHLIAAATVDVRTDLWRKPEQERLVEELRQIIGGEHGLWQ